MRLKTALRVAGKLAILLVFTLSALKLPVAAQNSDPDRDQLLNGLRIIFIPQPGNGKASLQLRIHSGASFDPAGKTGLMSLLADCLFPEPESKTFFEEELGGSIDVTTDYDSINIIATGNGAEFPRMLDALRAGLVDSPLTNETVAKVRAEHIAAVKTLTPAEVADRAIAAQLLGQFPYGRSIAGTPESLTGVDRIDLNFARDRFLNPNNATLIVGGTFDQSRVRKLLRQQLGNWRRSDSVIPSTFRQPEPPNPRIMIVHNDGPGTEVRLAVRGLARSDADYAAAQVLSVLINARLTAGAAGNARFARLESHVLPGLLVLGGRVAGNDADTALNAIWDQAIKPLLETAPAAADLAAAKTNARARLNERQGTAPGAGGLWLDAETFRLASPAKQLNAVDDVTAADIQRVAARLFKDAPVARVAVSDVLGSPSASGTGAAVKQPN